MAQRQSAAPSLKDLREEFPTMPFGQFLMVLGIVPAGEIAANIDTLRTLLREEEGRTRRQQQEEEQRLREHFDAITVSLLHQKLVLPVLPSRIDREHALAYLVHGFIFPASQRTFAASRPISRQSIRRNVRNKLTERFEEAQLVGVEKFFLSHGVVRQGQAPTQFSLNIDENARGVTREGRDCIAAIKQFMFEHRSR
ncbi:hypothetical protein HYW67_03085 [Candidatus Parcubacteria bacterium]|nr:hypothetical protein [Candidatus Parcubacteria bacterium]